MCKERDKPYGLLIRKLDFPFLGSNAEIQTLQTASANSGGSVRPVSPPILMYRVYPDGREELVRGMRFRDSPPAPCATFWPLPWKRRYSTLLIMVRLWRALASAATLP